MDLFFYVTVITACSLIYYGYIKKKDTDLEIKKLEVEKKKIELKVKSLEKETNSKKENENEGNI